MLTRLPGAVFANRQRAGILFQIPFRLLQDGGREGQELGGVGRHAPIVCKGGASRSSRDLVAIESGRAMWPYKV